MAKQRHDPRDLNMKFVDWSKETVRYGGVELPAWFDVQLSHPGWPAPAVLSVAVSPDAGPVASGLRADRSAAATYSELEASVSATADMRHILGRVSGLMAGILTALRAESVLAAQGAEASPEEVAEALVKVRDLTADYVSVTVQPQRRRRMTRALLREVAEVYRKAYAEGEAPTLAVSERFKVAHRTAARWVAEARKVGELGPAAGTRPGEAKEGSE